MVDQLDVATGGMGVHFKASQQPPRGAFIQLLNCQGSLLNLYL